MGALNGVLKDIDGRALNIPLQNMFDRLNERAKR
jgi:hypothetical protein